MNTPNGSHQAPHGNGFIVHALRDFKEDVRTILTEHKEAITKRLAQIESSLANKSDRAYVNLLIEQLRSDLQAQAVDIEKIEAELVKKMNTEAMWKLVSVILAVITALAGFIGFLIQK
ncbi:hypothetical protein SCOR_32845 [Sulfidibacter corallicola]|uniref:Uncharacterized protein n=1 Tax=Sulfidibacter corallicola TaxID=2818388 RepID=A0A8A4TLB0_SULCO|nr:hypothetical protein [Sulfidibacter corallicola]QTD49671.1 hypothetical protein J3U87_29155 [Sulfidibacter corallicola]